MITNLLIATLLVASPDTVLVSAQWLQRHLSDPDLVVLQVGFDRIAYDEGHIPGARFAPLDRFHNHTVADRLPDPQSMAAALGAVGVSNRSRVIISGDPLGASILFVALEYLGMGDRTAVLDGGAAAWVASGGELSRKPVTITPATFTPKLREDLVVDAAAVQRRLGQRGVTLLDGRSRAEYEGTARESLPRRGHLPGARHLDWLDTFDPRDVGSANGRRGDNPPQAARLRPVAELERLFAGAGADRAGEVVTYCTVGMRASHLYFVARLLGYPVRIYVGSMADWTTQPSRPVVAGAK
ncbi:MAG TPA: sulfurtransferase [Gemmatimonadales bacterium]